MKVFGKPRQEGEPCETCKTPLQRLPKAFQWRGDAKDGVICANCDTLHPVKGDEIEPLKGLKARKD